MKGKLILEDGSSFEGNVIGADNSINGEVVFNTGMVGYPECLTDPSYNGQILVLTYPLIGNYGVPELITDPLTKLPTQFESKKIQIRGLIISDYSNNYNHWESTKSLSEWLKEHNIPALHGIDTRALTKKLREKGVMQGKITINTVIEFEDPNKLNLVAEVSCKEPTTYENKNTLPTKTVLLIDFGVKYNIIRSMLKRNLKIIRVPWNYDFINSDMKYDGIFLSNGPGNPKMCTTAITNLRKALQKKIPIFGICLGNQILALAAGADTYKLKYGHRSQNQPCVEVGTKRCFITPQNHGYAVDENTLPLEWEPWFTNANDGTNEGIKHKSNLFKAIQFHPEHCAGPRDTEFLFDDFIKMMEKRGNKDER